MRIATPSGRPKGVLVRRSRLAYFIAGVSVATVLAAVPATALVLVADPSPNTYDGASPSLNVLPAQFVLGGSLDAAVDPVVDHCSSPNRAVPMQMSWTGSDATSRIAGYDVWGSSYPEGGVAGELVHGTSATSYRFSAPTTTPNVAVVTVIATGTSGWWPATIVATPPCRVPASPSGWTSGKRMVRRLPLAQARWCSRRERGPGPRPVARASTGARRCTHPVRVLLTYTLKTQRPGQTVAVAVEKSTNRGVVNITVDGGAARQSTPMRRRRPIASLSGRRSRTRKSHHQDDQCRNRWPFPHRH